MVRFFIDGQAVEVDPGATILDGARKLGVPIPTLCFLEGHRARNSCSVCLVKVRDERGFVPACGSVAREGIEVESGTDAVRAARRTAIELLLSEHGGDCLGPCHTICPAMMNIPALIGHIRKGELDEAISVVKEEIALPAILGRICPAPCEKGCRRAAHDGAVSIRLLERLAGDAALAVDRAGRAACRPVRLERPDRSERVAVVGAGPAGLGAVFQLRRDGIGCALFDRNVRPGGKLRTSVDRDLLPGAMLDGEIARIEELGVVFRMGEELGRDFSVEELRADFDAVLVAVGSVGSVGAAGADADGASVVADRETFAADQPGLFAAGSVLRPVKLAVAALAQGKKAARSIARFFDEGEVVPFRRPFTTRLGTLRAGEMEQFLAGASGADRVAPAGGEAAGFTDAEARREAERCLRCDCAGLGDCRLREEAIALGARPSRFRDERRRCRIVRDRGGVVYEPAKCISCGLCVGITEEMAVETGLSFVGRGFDVTVAVPFDRSLEEGLSRAASACVAACPTGALVFGD
jgi:ferredoxin